MWTKGLNATLDEAQLGGGGGRGEERRVGGARGVSLVWILMSRLGGSIGGLNIKNTHEIPNALGKNPITFVQLRKKFAARNFFLLSSQAKTAKNYPHIPGLSQCLGLCALFFQSRNKLEVVRLELSTQDFHLT